MFALIISILAVLLAIAIAGISVYYGGDAFNNNKIKATATGIINQASQIEAAFTLQSANNQGDLIVGGRTSDDGLFDYALSEKYLRGTPEGNGGIWELKCFDSDQNAAFEASDDPKDCGAQGVILTLTNVEPDVCNTINQLQGYTYETTNTFLSQTVNAGDRATINDGYSIDKVSPTCSDEPNAACCDNA